MEGLGCVTSLARVPLLQVLFFGNWSLRTSPPPLEWTLFPSLVTAVLITLKGAEPPGSRRIGVVGALVYFLPPETV